MNRVLLCLAGSLLALAACVDDGADLRSAAVPLGGAACNVCHNSFDPGGKVLVDPEIEYDEDLHAEWSLAHQAAVQGDADSSALSTQFGPCAGCHEQGNGGTF